MRTFFKIGKYYNFTHTNGSNWIAKITDIKYLGRICIEGFFLNTDKFRDSWTLLSNINVSTIRDATPNEIQWLDECIKNKAYTSPSLNTNTYIPLGQQIPHVWTNTYHHENKQYDDLIIPKIFDIPEI